MSKDKKFWQSKKCLAYLILMIASTAIIAACVITRQGSDVIREALSAYGLAVTAATTALIGGQSFIDSRPSKEEEK
tara:strand:- start:23171 stop:23398 length:228 start_codon:yes stop_codon:yes gene_type:complete